MHMLRKYLLWGLACALTIGLLFTPLRLIGYILPIGILAYIIPTTRFINSYFFKLVLSFIFLSCFQITIAAICWLLKVSYSLPIAVGTEIVAVSVFGLFKGRAKTVKFITWEDLYVLVAALGGAAIVLIGVFGRGPLLPQLLRFVTTGFDHTTHISMTLSVYQNQGFIYGPADEVTEKIVYRDFTTYPQGWHLNNSTLWRSISNNLSVQGNQIGRVLLLYIISTMLWYVLIVFLFGRLVVAVIQNLSRKKRISHLMLFGALGVTVLAELTLFLGMIRYGFGSFLPVLLYTLTILLLALHLPKRVAQKNVDISSVQQILLLSALVTVGMAFSWLLAVPVLVVFMVLVYCQFFSLKPKAVLLYIRQNWLSLATIVALSSIAALQLIIQLKYNQKVGQLNEDGAIGKVYPLLIFSSLVVLVGYLSARVGSNDNENKESLTQAAMLTLPGTFLLSSFVYFYQLYTAEKLTYYAAKVGFISTLLLMVFSFAILVVVISRLLRNFSTINKYVILGSILCLLPYALSIDTTVLAHTTGRFRKLSPESASQISSLLVANEAQSANVVVLKQLDYEEDLVTTHFLKMLARRDPECQRILIYYLLSGQKDKTLDQISSCAKTQKFYVIGSPENAESLKQRFKNDLNITVLTTT